MENFTDKDVDGEEKEDNIKDRCSVFTIDNSDLKKMFTTGVAMELANLSYFIISF